MDKRLIVGLSEHVTVHVKDKTKEILARIDTGATKSSIDADLAKELGLGPVVRTTFIKSANGRTERPVVKIKVKIQDFEDEMEFTVANRKNLKYEMLIGQDILKQGFLIDPLKDAK